MWFVAARWFLPIEGDLKLGGKYQLKGNAGGTITQRVRRQGILQRRGSSAEG